MDGTPDPHPLERAGISTILATIAPDNVTKLKHLQRAEEVMSSLEYPKQLPAIRSVLSELRAQGKAGEAAALLERRNLIEQSWGTRIPPLPTDPACVPMTLAGSLSHALARRSTETRDCCRKALDLGLKPEAQLQVYTEVDRSGKVAFAQVITPKSYPTELGSCMYDVIRSTTFAPPPHTLHVTFPFVFKR